MDQEHESHLRDVKYNILNDLDRKYRQGQIEHGGNLWEKPGMLDNAIEEVIDLAVYLYTLKEQMKKNGLL
jgi:hypothetical protein